MTKVNPTCGDCGEVKDRSEFYVDRKRANGLHTYCKDCCKVRAKRRYAEDPEGHKERHRKWVEKNSDRVRLHKLKSTYGVSAEEYLALPQVCVICGATERLRLDHSHQSGRVRGLLCDPCNKGLGFFGDNPTFLLRAAEYVLGVAKPDIFEATYDEVRVERERGQA
ncbi:endonuclease VII domain-containing protein [Prauserella endophytica]|uniref:endonuclease VII domain-containing protein n=1 Tax=Prauserella endophytica TaxID=1592324 RepID=UPI0013052D43|nr:endonuclease VII domain-containing protein [Prauserella endophytica]